MTDLLNNRRNYKPLKTSPLRNSTSVETLEKASSEPTISPNRTITPQLVRPKSYTNKVIEIFFWEIDQRKKKFKIPYSFETCWECDAELILSKKRKRPLGLDCQCPGMKLFCSRYCRYTHWAKSDIKMCSKISLTKINEPLTIKEIKKFNKVTKYLEETKSMVDIDF